MCSLIYNMKGCIEKVDKCRDVEPKCDMQCVDVRVR